MGFHGVVNGVQISGALGRLVTVTPKLTSRGNVSTNQSTELAHYRGKVGSYLLSSLSRVFHFAHCGEAFRGDRAADAHLRRLHAHAQALAASHGTQACTHSSTHTHPSTPMHAHTQVCTHTLHTSTYASTHTHKHTCMHAHANMGARTCTYTSLNACSHTHAHTSTHPMEAPRAPSCRFSAL